MSKQVKKKYRARKQRHQRSRMKIVGSASRPRLNIYRSLTNIYAQVIDDTVGKTLVSASTIDKEVAGLLEGKSRIEAAQLVGKTVGERAQAAGITQVVFDRGGYKYHGRVAAVAEGAREAGLEF